MRSSRSPLCTICPSFTGMSMISPETSGEIFTSTSGWILPVAVTSCVMFLRNALSVVTGIGFSRFPADHHHNDQNQHDQDDAGEDDPFTLFRHLRSLSTVQSAEGCKAVFIPSVSEGPGSGGTARRPSPQVPRSRSG